MFVFRGVINGITDLEVRQLDLRRPTPLVFLSPWSRKQGTGIASFCCGGTMQCPVEAWVPDLDLDPDSEPAAPVRTKHKEIFVRGVRRWWLSHTLVCGLPTPCRCLSPDSTRCTGKKCSQARLEGGSNAEHQYGWIHRVLPYVNWQENMGIFHRYLYQWGTLPETNSKSP